MIEHLCLFVTIVAALQANHCLCAVVLAIRKTCSQKLNRPRCEICGDDAMATRAVLSSDGFRSINLCAQHMHEAMLSDREKWSSEGEGTE